MAINVSGIIGAFVAIVVGTALVSPIATTVSSAQANVTGATSTIIGLITLLFGVGLLVVTVKGMIGGGK